jgi:hypothetical protein
VGDGANLTLSMTYEYNLSRSARRLAPTVLAAMADLPTGYSSLYSFKSMGWQNPYGALCGSS